MLTEWWKWIATFVAGAAALPLLQKAAGFIFTEGRKKWEGTVAARRVIATQLDPLLKAADDLYGKLRALADEDFADFRRLPAKDLHRGDLVNLCSTLYLFAQFWGRLEVVRRESFHAELSRNKDGKGLLQFLRCLQSKRVRLVERAWQRAIGESVLLLTKPADVLSFKAFVEQYECDENFRAWLQPLEAILRETRYPRARQRVLQYGVVLNALIDTLDSKHHTTKERPAYPNKLTRRAKRELIGRVFDTYVPKVRNQEKYTGIRR
jgi:hypothetical protein